MPTLTHLSALEILDSRGRPTVKATIRLSTGVTASASVPSGASTGAAEAIELRDGDPTRYAGLGCKNAVSNINHEIARHLSGKTFNTQSELDQSLIALDGTKNKSRLGANAILAVTIAFARACAADNQIELYEQFRNILHEGQPPSSQPLRLPRLTVNLFSGGKHAGQLGPAVQDVLLVPAAPTIDAGLAQIFAVYQAAAKWLRKQFNAAPLSADEGGLAPPVRTAEELLDAAVAAITAAGLIPGEDMFLAVDVASSHFYTDGFYNPHDGPPLTSLQMIEHLARWVERYPIVSIEDGLAEDDWQHWPHLRTTLESRATAFQSPPSYTPEAEPKGTPRIPGTPPFLVLGDDLLCTTPARIQRAIDTQSANALLLKVNQIGTLTEAAQACRLARSAHWSVTISARSGETEDNWLADLAVGWAGDQIKVGSITQSERLAKYNRLLEIESATGWAVNPWPAPV